MKAFVSTIDIRPQSDLNKSQNKLRSNWRERLSGVKSVKTADTVTAKYRLSRREFPVETAGRLDWNPKHSG